MRGTTRETGYSILVMVDITERKHAQQKLDELLALEQAERRDAEQARVEAEAANRAKDHFLAMISHELRSPLQGIVGRVEIIRHGVDRQQQEQALAAIDRAVARQARLVKDLLDISSIVSGKIQIEHRLVNPARIAQRAVQAAMPAAREKRLELSADVAESRNVLGDEDRLALVVNNLLNNAIEFTPDGGSIRSDAHPSKAGLRSELRTAAKGSRQSLFRNCLSASTKLIQASRSATAGWDWDSRSLARWWNCTAEQSRRPASA